MILKNKLYVVIKKLLIILKELKPNINRVMVIQKIPAFLISTLGFFFVGCSSSNQNEDFKKPNVIIILSDDQGWGDFSATGNTNITTPNIDKLAEKGATLTNFYVQPVCSPTRAELLTGRYHQRSGVHGTSAGSERLDLDETTIGEVFKRAGYATAAYGKWHNGMQPPYHPNSRGFDDYYGFCSGHWGNYFSPMLEHNGKLVTGEGYIIDDFTNHGIDFIEKHADEPFLLYLPFNTPHGPLQVPDRWWNEFKNKELTMKHRDPEREDEDYTRAALAMCENIDWNVGRLMDKVDELGIEDNTIVLYFNDNGPNGWRWNGGMKGKKGSTDEGGVRSPLFIKWPNRIEPGTKINEVTAVIDLLPTLAELVGIDFNIPRPLDGKSFKPLLLERNPTWNDRNIFSYWAGRLSVRNQHYRLDHEGRLFHIENDRGQHNDISHSNTDIHKDMLSAASSFRNEVVGNLGENDDRPFTIGYPEAVYTQMPARDAVGHGNIVRSNRWPNCSFYTNWTSINDSITWDVEVLAEGDFAVTLYYTCPKPDVGSVFELSLGNSSINGQIQEAHDPPLRGMERDRVERQNSYVKDFKPLELGTMHLEKGNGTLTLKALEKPGNTVMDFRLLMFERMN